MRNKGRLILVISAALVLGIVLTFASCSGQTDGDGDTASNVKNPNTQTTDIVFWGWGNDAYYQNYYDNFAADMPEYNLVHDVGEAPFSEFVSAYLAQNAPDSYISWTKYKKQMMYTDMLAPLEDYYKTDTAFDITKLNGTVVSQGTGADGKFYFWGDINGSALYYNKNHYSAAALDPEKPPKTWSELIQYAKACTVTDNNNVLTQMGIWDGETHEKYYAAAMGVSWFDHSGETLTVNDAVTQKVFEFCKSIPSQVFGGRDKIPSGKSFGTEFNNLSMDISNVNVRIHQLAQFAGTSWGMSYIPVSDDYTGEQKMVSYSSQGFCIPKNTKNPEGAWKWTRWYFTNGLVIGEKIKYDQNPSKFSPYINTYAPTKEIVDNMYTKDLTDKDVKAMLSLRDQMVQNTFAIEDSISSVVFDEAYTKWASKIYTGEMTVKDALNSLQNEAQTQIGDWLKENGK